MQAIQKPFIPPRLDGIERRLGRRCRSSTRCSGISVRADRSYGETIGSGEDADMVVNNWDQGRRHLPIR